MPTPVQTYNHQDFSQNVPSSMTSSIKEQSHSVSVPASRDTYNANDSTSHVKVEPAHPMSTANASQNNQRSVYYYFSV